MFQLKFLSLIILLYSLLLIMVVFSRGNLDEFSQEIDDNGIQFLWMDKELQ